MITITLVAGVATIAAQGLIAGGPKIQFTRFECGDAVATADQMATWDVVEAPLPTMQGNVVFSGSLANLRYTPDVVDQGRLTCYVSEAVAQIPIANVVLYASVNGVERPYSFSAAADQFIKLQTQPGPPNGAPGFEFWFDLTVAVPNLLERFDFSNLPSIFPEFLVCPTEQNLPHAAFDGHDDFLVNAFSLDNRPAAVFNWHNLHFGMSLARPLTPGVQDTNDGVSGGTAGDAWQV